MPTLLPARVVPTLLPARVVPTLLPARVVPTLLPARVVPIGQLVRVDAGTVAGLAVALESGARRGLAAPNASWQNLLAPSSQRRRSSLLSRR
ncbi:MAG: hypothetical protein KC609_04515 [Myxococcales bacterium]|nr:hypothetical protein [Myxococcales bacterium]